MSKSKIRCLGILALTLVLWPQGSLNSEGASKPMESTMVQTVEPTDLTEAEREEIRQLAIQKSEAEIQAAQEAAKKAKHDQKVTELSEYSKLDVSLVDYLIKRVEEQELPLDIVAGLIEIESSWKVNERNESSGATGLAQIMPSTARYIAEGDCHLTNTCKHPLSYYRERLKDPYYNVDMMVARLEILRNEYGEDWNRILTGYNRGEQGLQDWIHLKGTPVSVYSKVVKTRAVTIENIIGPL